MEWLDEVQQKIRHKNQILFSKDCPLFDPLNFSACTAKPPHHCPVGAGPG